MSLHAFTEVKYSDLLPAIRLLGNSKGGSISVPLTSCLTGLDYTVFQIKTIIFSCHTADSEPVKQEVNGTVILPPFSIPCLYSSNFNLTTSLIIGTYKLAILLKISDINIKQIAATF